MVGSAVLRVVQGGLNALGYEMTGVCIYSYEWGRQENWITPIHRPHPLLLSTLPSPTHIHTGPTPTPTPIHSPRWLSAQILRAAPLSPAKTNPTTNNDNNDSSSTSTITSSNPLLPSCPTVLHLAPFPATAGGGLPRFLTAAGDAEASLLPPGGTSAAVGKVEPEVRIYVCGET